MRSWTGKTGDLGDGTGQELLTQCQELPETFLSGEEGRVSVRNLCGTPGNGDCGTSLHDTPRDSHCGTGSCDTPGDGYCETGSCVYLV